MRALLPVALLALVVSLVIGQENGAIKDITEAARKQYAIGKTLEVIKAVEDITAIAADGPKVVKVDMKPLAAGWYLFVFANVDNKGFAYETRTVRLEVSKAGKDAAQEELGIGPDSEAWDGLRFGIARATTSTIIHANWSINMGRGGPCGWQLASVKFSEKEPVQP